MKELEPLEECAELDADEICEIGAVSEETHGTIGMTPEGLFTQP